MRLELNNEVTLNLNGDNCTQKFSVKKGNNLSNIFIVSIKHNDEIITLDGLTARYCVKRADGTQSLSDAIIQDNTIKITLTQQDLSEAGLLSCEVILSKDKTIVFTSIFYVDIIPSALHQEKIKNTDDYSSLINTLDRANEIIGSISLLEEEISDNEALRVSKESIRTENENVRQSNELERITSFGEIESKSNQVITDNEEHTQNAKTQAEYAKTQGNYAKEQADRIKNSDVGSLQEDIDDIKGYIGYTQNNIYGVEVDFKNNVFTRIAGATNLTEGADFDSINAYKRKRCVLSDDGEVIAYFGDEGYIEDGSLGQVMVEQPKFYYKVVPLKLEPITNGKGFHLRKARYYVSDTQKEGFKLHPAFIQNGVEKDKIYLSAYEGSIYDTSASAYLLNDEQVADFNVDKLSSIANAKPCGGKTQQLTRANSRKLANNRGIGWNLSTIQSISCTQLLFLIEYASFNMQDKIGVGLTQKPSSYDKNYAEITGSTSHQGDKTCSVDNGAISYRGEENFYGNMWNMIDGINIYNNTSFNEGDTGDIYISDNSFKEDSSDLPYQNVGFSSVYLKNGFISAFGYSKEYDWVFIPSENIGNSIFPVGDNAQITNPDWRIGLHGGSWTGKDLNGGFNVTYYVPTNNKSVNTGCRLLFIK